MRRERRALPPALLGFTGPRSAEFKGSGLHTEEQGTLRRMRTGFQHVRALGALSLIGVLPSVLGADLLLPRRPANAPAGAEFARRIAPLDLAGREREILIQIGLGNVPEFWRRFAEVRVCRTLAGRERTVAYRVSPDYLVIGADEDYFLMPVTPGTAQSIADRLDCVLPTRRMVDDIYAAAPLKLEPVPIPPSPAMTTVAVFQQHNENIRTQRTERLAAFPPGSLVGGHKKDVVITTHMGEALGKVAIYGWHRSREVPIQPLYLGHAASWVDYSHGVRLIQQALTVDGVAMRAEEVLADPVLCGLLSDEGPVAASRYGAASDGLGRWRQSLETTEALALEPGVRVTIHAAAAVDLGKAVRLVLYALPNGNTIEQTVGRQLKPGDDWHFNIQHIGAQTRWLRERMSDANLVVAYLECAGRAWPAWRRQHDPNGERIASIVESLRSRFTGLDLRLVLSGHSGGGSFTFGFLDQVKDIPADVERIAFLDSDYAYDHARGHDEKLACWLAASDRHYLCVLAYHDSVALLNGKTFVSASGGTWGRSLALQQDLAARFPFVCETDSEFQRYTALDGRVRFLLKENPTRAVLHTRQVEWNGFIHAMLLGTEWENKGYTYFGPRVYGAWINAE